MRGALARAGLVAVIALRVCLAASAPVIRIKLERFVVPPSRTAGLLVKARINGGPLLRLLLDSGSEYVVVNRAAALGSHCGGASIDLVGVGAGSATRVERRTADTLEIGDLTLHRVPLIVANRTLADGVQGVLPLSVFAEFLIRLDFPAKQLDLLPYPMEEADQPGAVRVLLSNRLLFVKTTVNHAHDGYFLLDTGSAYTAISRGLAGQLHISEILADRVPLRGGTEEFNAPLLSGLVQLQFASRPPVTGPVVSVDLSTASRYHGFDVSGLIGYSALCDSILIADYRDGLIRIAPK